VPSLEGMSEKVAKEEKTAAALFAKLKFLQQREKNTLMK
jgi:hypothetical protein